MAESVADIANMALRHLAITKRVTDAVLTADATAEAKAINDFYEQTRDEVLRDFPWPFATVIEDLTLDESEPNTEWAYAYDVPSDFISVSRFFSGIRPESRAARVPFRITGRRLLSNLADATLEYVTKVEDVEDFPPDFVQALALKLAAYIAPSLTGGDPTKLGFRALQLYDYAISRAKTNAANESQPEEEGDSPFIAARS